MLNISLGPNVFLGLMIIIGVVLLYFLRDVEPEISRDEDLFFVTIISLYSLILIIHGWRLDPILLFSQLLIILTVLFGGWENIRLRGLVVKIAAKLKNKDKS